MSEERKYLLYSIVGVMLIMFSVFWVTYTWLNTRSSLSGKDKTVIKEKGLITTYTGGTTLTVGNIKPGERINKNIKIKNNSTGAINYNIIWSYVENDFNNEKNLLYSITGGENINKQKICPSTGSNIPIVKNITIEKNTTQEYNLLVTHKIGGKRKNTNIFKGKISIVVNTDEVSVE